MTSATAVLQPAPRRRRWSVRSTPWRHPALALFTALVVFYLVFPLLVTVPISFNSIQRIEFHPPATRHGGTPTFWASAPRTATVDGWARRG